SNYSPQLSSERVILYIMFKVRLVFAPMKLIFWGREAIRLLAISKFLRVIVFEIVSFTFACSLSLIGEIIRFDDAITFNENNSKSKLLVIIIDCLIYLPHYIDIII
ncbi:MAG: hypothetical protein AABX98_05935, partial [Nanoarchaeota archaeon]